LNLESTSQVQNLQSVGYSFDRKVCYLKE